MLNDPKLKREILIAVIVTALTMMFISPMLSFISNASLWIVSKININLLSSIYKSAAFGYHETPSFILLGELYGFLLAFSVGVLLFLVLGKTPDKNNKTPKPDTKTALLEEVEDELRKAEIKLKEAYESLAKSSKWSKYSEISLAIFLIIYSLVGRITTTAEHELINSFNKRLIIMAPKLSEQEEEELKAEWASMASSSDYAVIVDKMDGIAKTNKLKLPKASKLWD